MLIGSSSRVETDIIRTPLEPTLRWGLQTEITQGPKKLGKRILGIGNDEQTGGCEEMGTISQPPKTRLLLTLPDEC